MITIKDISVSSINYALRKLWIKICCLTQKVKILEEGGSGGAELNSVYVASLNDITTNSSLIVDSIIVMDETKGGEFLKYSGPYSDDGGVVITDANGQKWKRVIDTNYINVLWYPVVEGVAMDAQFTAIMAAASSKEILPFPRIYFPANTTGVAHYFFNSTVVINDVVEIFGDGAETRLKWALNVPGIVTNYITSRGTQIHDLLLDGGSSGIASGSPLGSNWSTTQYGLEPKDIIFVRNVTLRFWAGSAVYLYGVSGVSNVNNCVFENVLASQNRLHGFYIQGPDANAIQFNKCDAISNGGVGFFDASFLGNHFLHNHSASNGSPEITWQRGLVKNGTDVYACIVDGTVGIEPGVTPGWATNWVLTGKAWSGFAPVQVYNATRVYYTVGAYYATGVNQYGTFLGNYAEADQAASFMTSRNLILGSNAEFRNTPAMLNALDNSVYSLSPFFVGAPSWTNITKSRMNTTGFQVVNGTKTISLIMSADGLTGSLSPLNMTNNAFTIRRANINEGIGFNFISNRSYWGTLDFNYAKPTAALPFTTTSGIGGLVMHSPMFRPALNEDDPEVISYKYTQPDSVGTPYSNVRWFRTVGEFEWELDTTNATPLILRQHGNTSFAIFKANIKAVGKTAAGDVISIDRVYLFKTGTPPTLISTTDVVPTYTDAALATANVGVDISGNNLRLFITGVAATTINWKVRVNRIYV